MDVNFSKTDGLIPAVIQDAGDEKVLMVGFMNQEALDKTRETGQVTFYSRSRNKLWTKGETSGHYLLAKEILRRWVRAFAIMDFEAVSTAAGKAVNGSRSKSRPTIPPRFTRRSFFRESPC